MGGDSSWHAHARGTAWGLRGGGRRGQSGVYKELARPSGLQASSFLQTALTAVSLFTFASKAVREPLTLFSKTVFNSSCFVSFLRDMLYYVEIGC